MALDLNFATRLLTAVLSLISVAYLIYGGWRYMRARDTGDFAALAKIRGGLQVACAGIGASLLGFALFSLLTDSANPAVLSEFANAVRAIAAGASVFGATLLVYGGWKYMRAKEGREDLEQVRRSVKSLMNAVFVLAVALAAAALTEFNWGPFAELDETAKPLIAVSALMASSSLFLVKAILKNVREVAGE